MTQEPDLNVFDVGAGEQPEEMTADQIAIIVKDDIQKAKDAATAFVVSDQASMTAAEQLAQDFKRRQKVIDEKFAKLDAKTKKAKSAADEARSALLQLVRELKAPFDAAMRILDQKCLTWRRAEQKRLDDEAEKKRKEEQKRLDDEKAAKLKEAAAKGDAATFKAIEKEQPVAVVEAPKVEVSKGTTYAPKWEAILWVPDGVGITNEEERKESALLKLVKAIALGDAPITLVKFDNVEANAMARRMKDKMQYPGILARDAGKTTHRI